MSQAETYLETQQTRYLDELLEFLRIPSISSLPEHAADVERAADWVAARLRAAGIENVQILPTGGHPVVYGDWLHAAGQPTILIYGHFDIQPVDPVELWTAPPFEPVVRDGRVYARGASDDKGNMLVPILAVEALLSAEGMLPLNVKFLFEGQEEIGSPQIPEFVAAQRERLACDLVVSADGGQWSETEPSILLGLRGGCGVQIDVYGAKSDLHSGLYGGTIQNPIHALVQILDSLRDADGKILVEGFFDDVVPSSDAERAMIAAVPFDEQTYLEKLGVDALYGEPGYTTYERTWTRPTLEINGIYGGFQGDGIKTVLPNAAHAKITCRLVPNQDPATIAQRVIDHVRKHAPHGVQVRAEPLPFRAQPYVIAADHPGNQATRAVLTELYGRTPYDVRTGGSVPIVMIFLQQLGVHTVDFGFGLPDEQIHAPNEFFRLDSFERGQRAYTRLLRRLADLKPSELQSVS
jgi:acetylornithine deacetylase/succinyl-diaminopimelate desuccinylase-like protein